MKREADGVGGRIREIRKELNLSQQVFGQRLQVTKAHISKMELGHDKPSNMLIKLLCIEFNINEKWLRTGIGPKRFMGKVSEKASGLYATEAAAGKVGPETGAPAGQSPNIDPVSEYKAILRALAPGGAEAGYIPFMKFPELIDMINYLQRAFVQAQSAEDKMRLQVKFEILFPDYKNE